MKILHLYKDYYPVIGGIENYVKVLAEAQVRRGHKVTVLVTSLTRQTKIERHNGVLVIKAGRLAHIASTPLSLSLPFILARLKPDIAHLQFPYPFGEFAALLGSKAPRLVFTYHSDVVRQAALLRLYRPLMQRILQRADAIIATSPPYVESSEVLRAYREKVHVVPLGVHTAAFAHENPARVATLQGEWSPDGEPLILFVGRFRYYKGLDVLLRAVPHLRRGRILLVGDGPERRKLDALCTQLGLEERVYFLGSTMEEELIALRHATRRSGGLFVLPATHRSEAFGTVLLEAMAAGLPLVTTELGTGTSWVNQEGVTGRVVPANNPTALAEAINQMLADPALLQTMQRAARTRAQRFDLTQMVEGVEGVYDHVMGGSGFVKGSPVR
ncbi:MAG: glycosyltransferase [Ardenticatenales bacterium]|nr:glycosyltransferase [Ardenticatenales bacterium]